MKSDILFMAHVILDCFLLIRLTYFSSFSLVSRSAESWKTAPLSKTCSRIALKIPSTVVNRPPSPDAPNSLSNSGISMRHVSDYKWDVNRIF